MQSERIAEASALSGSVRGLGVCDALRLELVAAQLPGLVEQIAAAAAALRDEIEQRTAASVPGDGRGADQVEAVEAELRLVESLRDQLPTQPPPASFVVIGPAGAIGTMVGGRHAARSRGVVRAGARDHTTQRRRARATRERGGRRVRLDAELRRSPSGRGLHLRELNAPLEVEPLERQLNCFELGDHRRARRERWTQALSAGIELRRVEFLREQPSHAHPHSRSNIANTARRSGSRSSIGSLAVSDGGSVSKIARLTNSSPRRER